MKLERKKRKKMLYFDFWKKAYERRKEHGLISQNILENQAFQRTAKIIEMNDIVILAEVDGCTISWKVS